MYLSLLIFNFTSGKTFKLFESTLKVRSFEPESVERPNIHPFERHEINDFFFLLINVTLDVINKITLTDFILL